MNANSRHPSMDAWSRAWLARDEAALGALFAETAVVMHPRKRVVVGRQAILDFLRGGMGRADVRFFPSRAVVVGDTMLEHGEYRDFEPGTTRVLAHGDYAVTWIREGDAWRLALHTWNSP